MINAFDQITTIEYSRQTPASLLQLFRSKPDSITNRGSAKRIVLDSQHSSLTADYLKISDGLWCIISDYSFLHQSQVFSGQQSSPVFFELEYFIVSTGQLRQVDGDKH